MRVVYLWDWRTGVWRMCVWRGRFNLRDLGEVCRYKYLRIGVFVCRCRSEGFVSFYTHGEKAWDDEEDHLRLVCYGRCRTQLGTGLGYQQYHHGARRVTSRKGGKTTLARKNIRHRERNCIDSHTTTLLKALIDTTFWIYSHSSVAAAIQYYTHKSYV